MEKRYSEFGTWRDQLEKDDRRSLVKACNAVTNLYFYTKSLHESGLSGGDCLEEVEALLRKINAHAKTVFAEEIKDAFDRTPNHMKCAYFEGPCA